MGYEPSELRKEPLPIPIRRTFPRQGHATNFRNIAARTILAQHLFAPTMHHLFQPNGRKETLDSVLRGNDAATWQRSLSNEIGRLAQGNDYGVTSTDTIEFIRKVMSLKDGQSLTPISFSTIAL